MKRITWQYQKQP